MILDGVLILLIVIAGIIGFKKGFINVIIKLGTVIIALICALFMHNSVSNFIGETMGLNNTIETAIENKLYDFTKNKETSEKETNIPLLEGVLDEINDAATEKKTETISRCAKSVTKYIVKGLSFLCVFFVVSITMGIIGLILNTVVKLPVLNQLNGTLGAAFEIVLVIFVIFIILALISILSPFGMLKNIVEYIDSSSITKWIYENNIIISIIGKGM